MEFHEAANIFPLDEENLSDLAKDIRKHGQQVPIEILDGKIIDGRRRFKACRMAGIEPKTRNISTDDAVAHVLSLNLHRRHLTVSQRAMVGARVKEIYERQAKERQREGGRSAGRGRPKQVQAKTPEPVKSQARDDVGKVVGTGGKAVDMGTKVLRDGVPELVKAVDQGEIKVYTAAKIADLSEEQQREAVKNPSKPTQKPQEPEQSERKLQGVGVIRAHEAINCLSRIPKNDQLRKRGFQIVTDWIKRNLRGD